VAAKIKGWTVMPSPSCFALPRHAWPGLAMLRHAVPGSYAPCWGFGSRRIAVRIWLSGLAFWAGVSSAAHAGSCWYYSDGPDSVVACDNGAFTVTDSHGHKRTYGDTSSAIPDRKEGRFTSGGSERLP
jgi:hypothetical protein